MKRKADLRYRLSNREHYAITNENKKSISNLCVFIVYNIVAVYTCKKNYSL